MRLQHLRLLLTLAETGSLRAAAQVLHVSQPALSKALKALEEEFGAALVTRTPRGVRLAPAGELLAARAAPITRELERAREEVAWHLQHAHATVTVGVSPAASILLAPGALRRFQARWPAVRVRLVDALYPQALARLRSGEFDLALGPLPPAGVGADLHLKALVDSPTVIAVRRGHALASSRQLQELTGAAWVLTGTPQGPGDPSRLPFAALGLPPPLVRLECESFATLLAVLPAMDALAVMPQAFFERHGPGTGLSSLRVRDELPATTLHLFTRAQGPLSEPAQRLLDAFEQEARGLQRNTRVPLAPSPSQ
jgi:LysR family transcriptional regulator of abg operon